MIAKSSFVLKCLKVCTKVILGFWMPLRLQCTYSFEGVWISIVTPWRESPLWALKVWSWRLFSGPILNLNNPVPISVVAKCQWPLMTSPSNPSFLNQDQIRTWEQDGRGSVPNRRPQWTLWRICISVVLWLRQGLFVQLSFLQFPQVTRDTKLLPTNIRVYAPRLTVTFRRFLWTSAWSWWIRPRPQKIDWEIEKPATPVVGLVYVRVECLDLMQLKFGSPEPEQTEFPPLKRYHPVW